MSSDTRVSQRVVGQLATTLAPFSTPSDSALGEEIRSPRGMRLRSTSRSGTGAGDGGKAVTGRRGAGESTIFQDKSGRWHGYISLGLTDNGKRDRGHVSAGKRSDVVVKLQALQTKRDAGVTSTASSGETFGSWLQHWLTTIAVGRVRPSTWAGYESKIRVHIVPALGHHRLERLQPEHLEQVYVRLVSRGLSPSSVLICHRIISRSLKVAHQRGRVARNVALLVEPPAARSPEAAPLTAQEARRVITTAAGTRNAARWSVALALGLRQGEAIGARWADVDLDTGVWRVRQQLRRQPYRHGCAGSCAADQPSRRCPQRTGGLTFSEPKTTRGRRSIGLPPQLLTVLRQHRQVQLKDRLAAGPLWVDHDLVFCQANGKPIDPRKDYGDWKALLTRAGVRAARLHDARHTAATLLLTQNVPARVVMEILGHSTIAVTQNIYQHVMPEVVTQAIGGVASLLLEPTERVPRKGDRQ